MLIRFATTDLCTPAMSSFDIIIIFCQLWWDHTPIILTPGKAEAGGCLTL